MNKDIIFKVLITSIICLVTTQVFAQKLPSIQEGNLFAPLNVRIDGNPGEWGTQLKAYNKATSIFYTIANDKNNLYLVIQSDSSANNSKIISGGITLKIENPEKNKTSIPFSITYPIIPTGPAKGKIATILFDKTRTSAADLVDMNNALEEAKEIFLSGNKAIPDSSISVYNELGIKAAQNFNARKGYIYELAVPLKYLSAVINEEGIFKYNIRLNGPKKVNYSLYAGDRRVDPDSPEGQAMIEKIVAGSFYASQNAPTDLTGTYQLTK